MAPCCLGVFRVPADRRRQLESGCTFDALHVQENRIILAKQYGKDIEGPCMLKRNAVYRRCSIGGLARGRRVLGMNKLTFMDDEIPP